MCLCGNLALYPKLKFWALALYQSKWRDCGLCVCLCAQNGAMLLVGMWWSENKDKLVEWKVHLDTMGIKRADLKDKFLFLSFAAFQTD